MLLFVWTILVYIYHIIYKLSIELFSDVLFSFLHDYAIIKLLNIE